MPCSGSLSATTRRARCSSARDTRSEEDRMKKILAAATALGVVCAGSSSVRGQAKAQLDAVQAAVSIAEIQKTLDAINIDRTSGRPGERQAAEYLARKLDEYGVKHTVHDARIYMSWPGVAEVI